MGKNTWYGIIGGFVIVALIGIVMTLTSSIWVNNCRPADSNFNGKTTCTGYVPNMVGSEKPYTLDTIYCGYNTTILGCTDKDD